MVTDVGLPAQFSRELEDASWLSDTRGAGATFAGTNAMGQARWTTTCVVTEWIPEEQFVWVVEDLEDPVATWGFRIEPTDEGCRLTMEAQLGTARTGLNEAVEANPGDEEAIVAGRMRIWEKNMSATVEGIRALAEGAA